jgi:hypothetical protein
MTRVAALWTLLALFVGRVAGQLAVALDAAPFLPPMDEWQSGLLPYPLLFVSQLALIAAMVAICRRFSRGDVRRWRSLGTPLWILGWIYAGAMVARYAAWMAIRPEERWTGDLIPVVFHLVLASFVLLVADHHRGDPEGSPYGRHEKLCVASERASHRGAARYGGQGERVGESEGRSPRMSNDD